MSKLANKVAVVTGPPKASARASPSRWRRKGLRGGQLCGEQGRSGPGGGRDHRRRWQGHCVQADISKSEEITRLFTQAKEAFGPLDVLVNNAGLTSSRRWKRSPPRSSTGSSTPMSWACCSPARGPEALRPGRRQHHQYRSVITNLAMRTPPSTPAARRRCRPSPRFWARNWRGGTSGSTPSIPVWLKRKEPTPPASSAATWPPRPSPPRRSAAWASPATSAGSGVPRLG